MKSASSRSFLLISPLFLFLAAMFVVPVALTLLRSFQDPELRAAMPRTAAALTLWDGRDIPGEGVMATFIEELRPARGTRELTALAVRLNSDISGFRTILLRTAGRLPPEAGPPLTALTGIAPAWGEHRYWIAMRNAAGPFTSRHILAILDMEKNDAGEIVPVPENRRVFRMVLLRTILIASVVTGLCVLFGYPIAYLLANASQRTANWLMLLVLVPFWSSVLVRTTGWMVLLQQEGLVNTLLGYLGLIASPLELIYNRTGVYLAMTQVLLPLFILPVYAVMKGIDRSTVRAARSLGATPMVAFRRVYVPQTRAGIAGGVILVFVSAIGFYVTPALIGGAADQMISYFIVFYTNQTLNWGISGALSLALLVMAAFSFVIFMLIEGSPARERRRSAK